LYNKKWKVFIILVILGQSLNIVGLKGASVPLTLSITPTIPSIPSDGLPHPAFYVSLIDDQKNPHPLPKSMSITLSSSDTRLQVQESVNIKATEYYKIINATSTITENKAVEITVSAPGYTSSKITVNVGPPAGTPQSLKVTILPNILLPLAAGEADVIVTLVDSYGNPTKARADLRISLSSSNLQIADVQSKTITILNGDYSAKTKVLTTGSFQGSTSITASTSNLKSDSATITVQGPSATKIYLGTPLQQTIDSSSILIGIVDKDNQPVKLVSKATVSLYSSNSSILNIQSTVQIAVGEWSTVIPLQCITNGTAKIFASAENLLSTNIQITVATKLSLQPTRSLRLTSLAPSFPADDNTYKVMMVQVVDSAGTPVTLDEDTRIDIFSESEATLDTASSVVINSSRSLALITAVTKLPGAVKVSAAATNINSHEILMTTYSPVPDALTIQAPPIPAGGEVEACLVATNKGIPAQVQVDSQVLFTYKPTDVAEGTGSITLVKKTHFKYITISGKAQGAVEITSSGSGLPTTKTSLNVLETRPSTFSILPIAKPIVSYNFPLVLQLISTSGGSTVTYEPITINLASSDTNNILVPQAVTIQSEKSEVLIYAKALADKPTILTMSSPGFISSTITITPSSVPISVVLTANDRYKTGETATLKATVTIDGSPIQGIPVIWKGEGLESINTIADNSGAVQNNLLVKEKENKIEVGIIVGEGSYFSTTKTIIGVLGVYTLQINTNAPLTISGLGNYQYGDSIDLQAPTPTQMAGIFGILNGKLNFKEWTGYIQSTEKAVKLTIGGDQQIITVNAVYTEDYFMMIVTIVVLLIILAAAAFIYLKRFRKTAIINKKTPILPPKKPWEK
jgi:hypothetical protein